jgi:hypothetical protein
VTGEGEEGRERGRGGRGKREERRKGRGVLTELTLQVRQRLSRVPLQPTCLSQIEESEQTHVKRKRCMSAFGCSSYWWWHTHAE